MKQNYQRQVLLSVVLVLLGNVLGTLLRHWIYRNIAFFLCGLIWILHPVMAGNREATEKELNQVRIFGGGILILIALFTRSYVY